MNKFKEGQKVKVIRTGKIGEIIDIDNDDFTVIGASNRCYRLDYGWYTVHDLEEVKEILDDEENEYLSNVIRPFRDEVENITKRILLDESEEYVRINLLNQMGFSLPQFKSNTMYRKMKTNNPYTLEELGL